LSTPFDADPTASFRGAGHCFGQDWIMKLAPFSKVVVSIVLAGFGPALSATAQEALPAPWDAQLAANIGLTPDQAQELTLSDLNALKYAKGGGDRDRWVRLQGAGTGATASTAQLAASIGLTPEQAAEYSLSELNALKYARDGDKQAAPPRLHQVSSRSGQASDLGQLATTAGLSPDQTAELTINDIAAAKYSRGGNWNR
jgi:hypothetical protein